MTTDGAVICGECESPIPASAERCPQCGTRPSRVPTVTDPQAWAEIGAPPRVEASTAPSRPDPPRAARPRGDAPPTASRSRPRRSPSRELPPPDDAPPAGELARELAQRLRTPALMTAITVAGTAMLTCVVVGALTAFVATDRSLIGFLHAGDGAVTKALRLSVGTTLATLDGSAGTRDFHLLPMIFGLVAPAGAAVGARIAAPSLAGASVRAAVGSSAAGGIVFAMGMGILALVCNEQPGQSYSLEFSIPSVLAMSALLACCGAALGALRAAPKVAPDRARPSIAPAVKDRLAIAAPPLLALAALLTITGLVAFAYWEAEAARGQRDAVTSHRSARVAALETVLFAPDFAVDTAGLAAFARFQTSVLPVDDDRTDELAKSLDDHARGRIFAYSSALPIAVFLPGLLLLVGALLSTALYSGYATARRAAAPTRLVACGWGASTGIVWAVALVALRMVSYAPGTGARSMFFSVLLLGTIAGAAGGYLAAPPTSARRARRGAVHG